MFKPQQTLSAQKMSFDRLSEILERIANGEENEDDSYTLWQLLSKGYSPSATQLGKFNVNIGEGKNIHIGDRIYQGVDAEALKEAIRSVLQEYQSANQPCTSVKRQRASPKQSLSPSLYLPSVSFIFETVTVNSQGQEIQRERASTKQWIEDLGKGIHLEMVAIPAGSFLMGSSEIDPAHSPTEIPQRLVTVPELWMSKYPITQAQWKAIVALPAVNRSLKANTSKFKGENLPIEGISWYDAVEFCDRLIQYTGRPYRLPSEAEWEYACRANTTGYFHFGEALNPLFSNYGNYSKPKLSRKLHCKVATTPVGSHQVANAFGLYDMHGNVWEWCLDYWYSNYNNAPIDSSPRIGGEDNQPRVIRGGSWFDPYSNCRSASRSSNDPEIGSSTIGCRVVFASS